MEVLAERLSQLDSHVEGAIRVVMFYDTLMRRRVDLPGLVRSSAGLAECVVGMRLHGTGQVIRMAPDGTPAVTPSQQVSCSEIVTLDDEDIGTVWLERPGIPIPLDDLVLDRLAIAVASAVERYGPARTTMADPALVELVISGDADDASRARALRLLGFAALPPVRVVAVEPGHQLNLIGARICPDRLVKAASLTDAGAILATTVDITRFPTGVRAGIGSAEAPGEAWRQARTALRFATDRDPVIEYRELGALAMLAEVPPQVARDNADVAAISRLASDPDDLETLSIYSDTGSLRRAADVLHMHHSSVARRLEQISRTVGFDVTDPTGSTRVRLALITWRLLTT
ncbi:PucR-like helix-turn-helix protein [Stackebrandtia endophytica]|uniref:PucR-like helix-turn-helix protein n=1 Tax=Stackebrandtia endophytica TaxID=1496996 RepID=A0A543APW2_9ACTN|nr:helix-turn-helix domain-containing protein [Stackebrandtia endophytica]TQL74589.1 PucR-like helix-turn-helix protein [Stackebrandtia endophytica]